MTNPEEHKEDPSTFWGFMDPDNEQANPEAGEAVADDHGPTTHNGGNKPNSQLEAGDTILTRGGRSTSDALDVDPPGYRYTSESIEDREFSFYEDSEIEAQPTNSRVKKFGVIAGGTLVAGLVAATIYSGLTRGEESEPSESTAGDIEPTEQEHIQQEHLEEADMGAPEEILGSERESLSEFQPMLMNGPTPEDILEQYGHNLNCMYNANWEFQQSECIQYILGGSADGELYSVLQRQAEGARDLRAQDSDWEYTGSRELYDSLTPRHEDIPSGVFITEMIVKIEPMSGETIYQNFRFRKVPSTQVDEELNTGQEDSAWILQSIRTVEPGTRFD